MGVSRFGLGGGGRPRQTDILLMMAFEAVRLGDRALDLKRAGGGVRRRDLRLTLRRFETAGAEAERVPVEAQAATEDEQGRDHDRDQEQPA
jgi:hypothetical protein